jgi:hypothetical protein
MPSSRRMALAAALISTVVDWFFKMAILASYKKSVKEKATIKLFFEHALLHFGLPKTIISNRGNKFSSFFWSILSMMDTTLTKLIVFHPQCDG